MRRYTKHSRHCLSTFPNTSKPRQTDTALHVAFSTLFFVFRNVVKHGPSSILSTLDVLKESWQRHCLLLAAYVCHRSLLYLDLYADLRLVISFQSYLQHLLVLHIFIWSWYSYPFSPLASKSPVSILFIRGRQHVLLNWTILWPSEGKCQLGLWARKIQFFFQGKTWFSFAEL